MANDNGRKKSKYAAMKTEEEFTAALIERTRLARELSGFRPEQMAEFLGIKVDTYFKYEYRTPIPRYLIPRFCALCRVSADWLLGVEGAAQVSGQSPFRRSRSAEAS
jgi:transcriptional regulator with XRE-family HTH domain